MTIPVSAASGVANALRKVVSSTDSIPRAAICRHQSRVGVIVDSPGRGK